jgi:hypothetical protein
MTTTKWIGGKGRISGFKDRLKPAPIQHISHPSPGQSCPQQEPGLMHGQNAQSALGEPLSIRMVSEMLGCSPWTIRQRYIPEGLPHLRSGPAGKLVFFRNQVVQWILQKQNNQNRKGGR